MDCAYFDAGVCRSCTLMGVPHATQVADKQARAEALVQEALVASGSGADAAGIAWSEPFAGAESGFRNRAKMVAGGTWRKPTLGILDAEGHGVDLRRCGVVDPAITAALPVIANFIRVARLQPYNVPERRGELKHVLVTANPAGQLMVRFVVRSASAVEQIRERLPGLLERLPQAAVVTANLLPQHKAALEGPEEIHLHGAPTLAMPVAGLDLQLRPQGFFQTNTDVAAALYRQAADWIDDAAPASVWDLYSGVGGFALSAAAPGRTVTGVEISDAAVEAATRAASSAGLPDVVFTAADATAFALASPPAEQPELVIVNPPRRGLGAELSAWLDASRVKHLVYSSCNAVTLAQDLERMPHWRVVTARVMDMFPQTEHFEVITLLERR